MMPLKRSLKRLLTQPDFVVMFLLLGISAVSLNFVVKYLKLHFRKQAVALRVALDAPDGIPATMGNWVLVTKDPPLSPDTEHVLGTNQYINRTYIDRRAIEPAMLDQMKDMSDQERANVIGQIEMNHPEAVINLGITYYTGLVDTVAHIPDRCYLADGFEVTHYQTRENQKFGAYANGRERTVSFRYLNFEDQTGQGRVSRNVAYLFHVNGHYASSPIDVRNSLANLMEPYGYYSKVELMTVSPSRQMLSSDDPNVLQEKSLTSMQDFLTSLLPQVERCLPDWDQLHAPHPR
jgi:hypothetical protein